MLSSIYQPMVGAYAISVYTWLYQQIPVDKDGYSHLEQQRKLFLALDLEPSERGRKHLIEQTSKLEAIGLLQTSRKYIPSSDDYVFEYQLIQPLSPHEFFKNQHFTMLLRDKIGKYLVLAYRDELSAPEPAEFEGEDTYLENISVPFYDLFKLNTQVIDYELEQALVEMAPMREANVKHEAKSGDFTYSDIIIRFPRESYNRNFVENMKFDKNQLTTLNYVANKYTLSLQETCRLLDEDGIFNGQGELLLEVLQQKANLNFRQGKKRGDERERYLNKVEEFNNPKETVPAENPVEMAYYLEVPLFFKGQCDVHQYNMLLRNDPYIHVLKKFFPGSVPDHILNIFEKIDLNYKLNEEVINVLIHYLKVNNLSWTKPYIDSIVSDMLGKQVSSYEQAVDYIRESVRIKQKSSKVSTSSKTSSQFKTITDRGRGKQKPRISIISNVRKATPLTEEELAEMRQLADKLDRK